VFGFPPHRQESLPHEASFLRPVQGITRLSRAPSARYCR